MKVTDRGKEVHKTLHEVKPVKNINKNWESFLEVDESHPKEVPPYIKCKPMEDNASQRNCQNQLRHLSLFYIARMPGEFDSRKV